MFRYILFENIGPINILALEMASPGNRHCADCIGALSFHILPRLGIELERMGVQRTG